MIFVMNTALSGSEGPSRAPSSGSSTEEIASVAAAQRRFSAGSTSSCSSPPPHSKGGPWLSLDTSQQHHRIVSKISPPTTSNGAYLHRPKSPRASGSPSSPRSPARRSSLPSLTSRRRPTVAVDDDSTNQGSYNTAFSCTSTSWMMDDSSNSYATNHSTKPSGSRRMDSLHEDNNNNSIHDDNNNDIEASEKSMEDESWHDFYSAMTTNTQQRPVTPQPSPVQADSNVSRRPIHHNKHLHNSLSALPTASVNAGTLPRPGMHHHRQASLKGLPRTTDKRNSQTWNPQPSHQQASIACTWQPPPTSQNLSSGWPQSGTASPFRRTSLTRPTLHGFSLSSIPAPTIVDREPNMDLKEIKRHVLTSFGHLNPSSQKHPACASKAKSASSSSGTIMTWMGLLLSSTLLALVYLHYHPTTRGAMTPFWQHWKRWHLSRKARMEERQAEFVTLLQHHGMDAERLLHDTDSDAHKAILWLAHEDPLQLQPQTMSQPSILLQRFALATFYFATHKHHPSQQPNGQDHNHYHHHHKWMKESNWMTEAAVCDWHGVQCELVEESDWFDATVGSSSSASDATHMLQEGSAMPSLDVVKIALPKHRLQGTLPPELRFLSQLMALDLSHNHMTGTLPRDPHVLGHFLRLTDLRLNHNRFSGHLPESIANNMILKTLHLDHNHFRGSIPASFTHNLRNLREFTLSYNQLTAALPSTVGGLKHIEVLEFNDNQLTGKLPSGLCLLTTLRVLQLQFNHLVGTFPSEFALGASKLRLLDVSHNLLTGRLSDDLGKQMSMLEYLDIAHNEMSGQLPKTLGQLSFLKHLGINHNQFTGWLPSEWGEMGALETLRLQNNKLGGSLPLQLANLSQLEELQIQNNLFRPNLPKKIKRGLPRLSLLHHGVYTSPSRKEAWKVGLEEEAKREIRDPVAEEHDDELLHDEAETGEADQIEAEESLLSKVDKLEQLQGGMAPDEEM